LVGKGLIGPDENRFRRSVLFAAVRQAGKTPGVAVELFDAVGEGWQIIFETRDGVAQVCLLQGGRRFPINHFAMLSPIRDVRLNTFREAAESVNLPAIAGAAWNELLRERIPDDDELVEIQNDFNDTPLAIKSAIEAQLAVGSACLENVFPRSSRYYERLVGAYGEGQTLEAFADQVVRQHVLELVKWRPFDGQQLALLCTAQPTLSAVVAKATSGADGFEEIIRWSVEKGDLLSRTAVLEAGLFRLKQYASLQDKLPALVDTFIAVGEEPLTRYELLSALVMVVYGELGRTCILASKPPFWRRLAAMAQAALIERCIFDSGIDFQDLLRWARAARTEFFLLQCYVDLRLEPRWLPGLLSSRQLRAELEGRVVGAAVANLETARAAGLWQLIDDVEGSLRKRVGIQTFIPGPLEGGLQPQMMPKELETEIIGNLSGSVGASSFVVLANVALLYFIPQSVANLAAEAVVKADYRLQSEGNKEQLVGLLHGLASVAAVTRSVRLADSIFILLRKSRRLYPDELSLEDHFRIGMVACASRAELLEWYGAVGSLLTDLSWEALSRDEASILHSHLEKLCHLVPELWATCSPAEAALRSVLNV